MFRFQLFPHSLIEIDFLKKSKLFLEVEFDKYVICKVYFLAELNDIVNLDLNFGFFFLNRN